MIVALLVGGLWAGLACAVGVLVGAWVASGDCCPHADGSCLDEPAGAVLDPETGRVWVA